MQFVTGNLRKKNISNYTTELRSCRIKYHRTSLPADCWQRWWYIKVAKSPSLLLTSTTLFEGDELVVDKLAQDGGEILLSQGGKRILFFRQCKDRWQNDSNLAVDGDLKRTSWMLKMYKDTTFLKKPTCPKLSWHLQGRNIPQMYDTTPAYANWRVWSQNLKLNLKTHLKFWLEYPHIKIFCTVLPTFYSFKGTACIADHLS